MKKAEKKGWVVRVAPEFTANWRLGAHEFYLMCILETYARDRMITWVSKKTLAQTSRMSEKKCQRTLFILERGKWVHRTYAEPSRRTWLGIVMLKRLDKRQPRFDLEKGSRLDLTAEWFDREKRIIVNGHP